MKTGIRPKGKALTEELCDGHVCIYTSGHTDRNTVERGQVHAELLDEWWVE